MDKAKNILIFFVVIIFFVAVISVLNFFVKAPTTVTAIEDHARHQVVSSLQYDAEEQMGSGFVWEYYKQNNLVGYSYLASGNAVLGEFQFAFGLDKDMKIVGVDIYSNSAALGLNSQQLKELCNYYIGASGPLNISVSDPYGAEILTPIINNTIQNITSLKEGANNE